MAILLTGLMVGLKLWARRSESRITLNHHHMHDDGIDRFIRSNNRHDSLDFLFLNFNFVDRCHSSLF